MTVSIPPLTLKASAPQTNVTSYCTDSADHPILEQISSLLPDLSQAGKVALVRGVAELLAVSLSLPTQPHEITLPLRQEATNDANSR
ncbi:hypothetical protein HRE53_30980 (plasmid) [Acaryochloris sp. 'Moss Beach']|uniref:hypothetical protein n=1 Tax=Acaryochloris TaxID=155977 RepID=UPI001F38468E|nr:hypothetical protein [Acaryochloris sp. 'Moss Beach']UJB73135.1 hypothetical protein HRE53_30980 [Acaryochloris sp. 'Moss Beach']